MRQKSWMSKLVHSLDGGQARPHSVLSTIQRNGVDKSAFPTSA